jgi:hypothetical protein
MNMFRCITKHFFLLAILAVATLALPATPASAWKAAAAADNSTDSPRHYVLPLYQFGYEVITEGTANYTIERTMRSAFPRDMDITVIYAWGYSGDKFTVKVTDLGDRGDRLFACLTAVVNGKATTEWGTMYSSSSQNSFDVTVPMESPGGFIYLLSGYFTPSLGDEPFSYTLTLAFPQ